MDNKITEIIDSRIIIDVNIDENEDVKFYTERLPLKIKELKSQLLLIDTKHEQKIIYFDNENLQNSTLSTVLNEELERLISEGKTWAQELQKLKNNQNINNTYRLLENLSCFNNIFIYFKLRVNDLVPTNNNVSATLTNKNLKKIIEFDKKLTKLIKPIAEKFRALSNVITSDSVSEEFRENIKTLIKILLTY